MIFVNLQDSVKYSFKNFHTRGLDYICLSRNKEITKKLYFLEGDVTKVPEVVNPHDHRYCFSTTVLLGSMIDHRWKKSEEGEVFNAFNFMTPLNEGSGFTFRGEEKLEKIRATPLNKSESLFSSDEYIHTIQMSSDQTVLHLTQYEDSVPLEVPTSCWSKDTPDISDKGLYDKFSEGEIMDKLKKYNFNVVLLGENNDEILNKNKKKRTR